MSRSRSRHTSTLSRLYDIGGADLALRYHEISGQQRAATPSPSAARAGGGDAVPRPRRSVHVNGLRISDEQVAGMERRWNATVADGRYWYDPACGAWGVEGGPCAAYTQPGLRLGGPLSAKASGGGTGVHFNGRELHPLDVAALTQVMPLWPMRYWLDAQGNFGLEGGAVLGNLHALAQRARATQGAWSVAGRGGTVGGDGSGFLFFNDGSTSWST